MSIQIIETLLQPDGTAMKCAEVKITTYVSNLTLKGTFIRICTDEEGLVNTPLLEGIYEIVLKTKQGIQVLTSKVEVTPDTPTPIKLTELITNYPYVEV